ncbi:hypothetical protein SCP_0900410 [Sparassis crispa]|uniref:F-box domain-containing protein n=1 Tax=Sparassis crispa TaxID=139825 RepID=A0A401GWL9_9APHY|nr:hypothetical protein SCP_0900410 [Sparassis crispa]GBE86164.1 hypothetical protein SCP_0900410 [Sparassis crispa]
MDDLLPLLKILETSFQLAITDAPSGGAYILQPDIPTREWQRFRSYAHRIRNLEIPLYREDIDPSVFVVLKSVLAGIALFPNLLALYLGLELDAYGPELLLFISPKLRIVDVETHEQSDDSSRHLPSVASRSIAAQFIYGVCSEASSLEHLIFIDSSDLDIPSIECASRLRELVITGFPITTRFLSSAANLPSLTTLQIEIAEQEVAACAGFPVLETLSLDGTVTVLPDFVRNIASPRVQKFRYYSDWGVVSGLHCYIDLYKALVSKFFLSLREIIMSFSSLRKDEDSGTSPLLVDSIYPLFTLSQLERLELKMSVSVSITNADLQTMTMAWPHLQTFVLSASPGNEVPSMYALTEFAQHCPELRTLCLPCVDPRISPPHEQGFNTISGHSLQDLWFSHPQKWTRTPFELEIVAVAQFLDALFPQVNLARFSARSFPGVVKYSAGDWKRVADVQKAMQAARQRG